MRNRSDVLVFLAIKSPFKLYTVNSNETVWMCGGSLINSRFVVTAAHCAHKSDLAGWNLTHVRLGEWYLGVDPDCDIHGECADPVKDYLVENVIIHDGYTPRQQQHHDIALLRLAEPVIYSYFIKPICLPTQKALQEWDYGKGQPLQVAGWGTTEFCKYRLLRAKQGLK